MLSTQIPGERRGLQKIAGCYRTDRPMDIVFIHGLGGDSWTTWMANENDIATFWPNWLAEDFSQVGLWTLGYAANSSKWKEESMPLADRGTQVLDLLEDDGVGERPLVFITHSMGGIVAKQLLRHAESYGVGRWKNISRQTRGIAFIATPHAGAHIASFAELASAVYGTNEHVKELTRLRLRPTRHVILFRHSRWSKPLDLSPDTMANHRPTGGRLATPDHGTLAFKPTAIMGSVEIS